MTLHEQYMEISEEGFFKKNDVLVEDLADGYKLKGPFLDRGVIVSWIIKYVSDELGVDRGERYTSFYSVAGWYPAFTIVCRHNENLRGKFNRLMKAYHRYEDACKELARLALRR